MPYASTTLKIANQAKIKVTSPYEPGGITFVYKGTKTKDSILGKTVANP
jgi:hypothetical protein